MDGHSAQRAAIAARLASQLGVACITAGEDACDALRQRRSCVIATDSEVDMTGDSLHVFLHDRDDAQRYPAGCQLCLDARLLGVEGSAELLKQFAVQQLMTRRASSRRV